MADVRSFVAMMTGHSIASALSDSFWRRMEGVASVGGIEIIVESTDNQNVLYS